MEMGVVRNGSELRRLEDTAVLCFFSHLAENSLKTKQPLLCDSLEGWEGGLRRKQQLELDMEQQTGSK